jgi:predicted RNA binding protein YcfA (HicA-like mRNA interferase family)
MPKLPVVKPRELIRALKKLGFFEYHQNGSHLQFKHKNGKRITVPVHCGRDIYRGTLRGIIYDINISVDDFINILKKK